MRLPIPTTLIAALVSTLALADSKPPPEDPPALRKGLWEYKRTMTGQGAGGKDAELTSKKCIDPAAAYLSMADMLAKQGCKTTAHSVKGNVRASATECPVQGGVLKSQRVMTIANDGAYTVDITTTGSGKTSRETLVAKRVGDC